MIADVPPSDETPDDENGLMASKALTEGVLQPIPKKLSAEASYAYIHDSPWKQTHQFRP